jgi:hypothetical protein
MHGLSLTRHVCTCSGFPNAASFKLPEGNYTCLARVYDSAGAWTASEEDFFQATGVPVTDTLSEEDAVASFVDELTFLAQSSGLLIVSDALMANFSDTCARGLCDPLRRRFRRLPASSSAAYRLRIRKLVFERMAQGSVKKDVSSLSSIQTLVSVDKLCSTPKELRTESIRDVMSLFEFGSVKTLAEQLRAVGMDLVVSISDKTVASSEFMPTDSARFTLLTATKTILESAMLIAVRALSSEEAPYMALQRNVGVVMARQSPGKVVYTSPAMHGSTVTYRYGFGAAGAKSRRQQAASEGVGVYVAYMSKVWMPKNASLWRTDVVGVKIVEDAVFPALASQGLLDPQLPKACTTPGCVHVWLSKKAPPEINSFTSAEYQSKGFRCFLWTKLWWDADRCIFGNVTFEQVNRTVLVQCVCSSDGFVYADWDGIPGDPGHWMHLTLRKERWCYVPIIWYAAILGFVALCSIWAVLHASRTKAISKLPAWDSAEPFHIWLACEHVRELEALWVHLSKPPLRDMLVAKVHEANLHTIRGEVLEINDMQEASKEFWREEQVAGAGCLDETLFDSMHSAFVHDGVNSGAAHDKRHVLRQPESLAVAGEHHDAKAPHSHESRHGVHAAGEDRAVQVAQSDVGEHEAKLPASDSDHEQTAHAHSNAHAHTHLDVGVSDRNVASDSSFRVFDARRARESLHAHGSQHARSVR